MAGTSRDTEPGRSDRNEQSSGREAALRLENIWFSYRTGFRIQGLHLEVGKGTFVSVIGPNGCGKSTLLRLLSGLLLPEKGSIRLQGRCLQSYPTRQLASVLSVIPSENHFEFPFRVREVVEMGRFPRTSRWSRLDATDREAVDRALVRTETIDLAERSIAELSSGERQRVLLARALAQEPSVLLLDEPNAHLDVKHQISTFRLLQDLKRDRGVTIVAVLHDLAMAAAFSDSVVVMHKGQIRVTGPPQEVIDESMIREVYGARVRVFQNPSGWPVIDYATEEFQPPGD